MSPNPPIAYGNKRLDKKDWQILELLCENSRLSHNQIARKIKLSKNATTYRISRLRKKNIISGFFTIINFSSFDIEFCELLIKTNANKKENQQLVDYLKVKDIVLVLDKLSGEWNFVAELGYSSALELSSFLSEFKTEFSEIINTFEVHPILESYKVEQLPIELIKNKKEIKPFSKDLPKIKLDKKDKQLLLELNKDSTTPLHILAEKLHVTYETIAARIKKLKQQKVILRFTAKINLIALDYDVYLLLLDLRNLSKETEKNLREHILANHQIRYSFMSAAKPEIFIYLAVKNSDELDNFMQELQENFSESIVNQNYLLSKEQYKYELFTSAMIG